MTSQARYNEYFWERDYRKGGDDVEDLANLRCELSAVWLARIAECKTLAHANRILGR